ncbi:MAG: hypothetical protein Q8P32_03960 [Candidatus Komeilibacteria bacterium]|nr:hypothetical protein [Candidatus Komeilibacteria bacterium]
MKELQIRQSPLNSITPSYRWFTIIFSVLAIILILAILYFALSQATVYITPNYQTQQIGFAVQVTENNPLLAANQNNTASLTGSIKELTVEDTKTFAAAENQISNNKATGEVTIFNRYSKAQPLIATTRLLTADNKLYRLTKTVNVPAGGQVTASVEADQPGTQFEIGPAKFTIPGLWEGLRDKIYAESVADFKISSRTQYQITQQLIDRAKEELRASLLTKAKAEISKELPEGQTLSQDALVAEVIKSSTTAKVGTGQKDFTVTLGLGVKAVLFDEAKMKEIAQNNLPDNYKNTETYIKVDANSFAYDITILDANSEHLIAQVKGEYGIQIATLNINPSELTKLSKTEAIKKLASQSGVKAVSISLPFWTKYLPALADKINIQIKE